MESIQETILAPVTNKKIHTITLNTLIYHYSPSNAQYLEVTTRKMVNYKGYFGSLRQFEPPQ